MMGKVVSQDLEGMGTPRASSFGLYLVGGILLLVILVVGYEYGDDQSSSTAMAAGTLHDSYSQWYAGKARGMELPKSPPPAAAEPEPAPVVKEQQPKKTPIRVARHPKKPTMSVKRYFSPKYEEVFSRVKGEAKSNTNIASSKRSEKAKRPSYYSPYDLEVPVGEFELKAGTMIPAILGTGLNSDLPGSAIAHVSTNVYDTVTHRHVMVPAGTTLIGVYKSNISYGQSRLMVVWNRLIFPNGKSMQIQSEVGSDRGGYSGFSDEVDNHLGKLYGGAFMLSLISGGVQLSQPNRNSFHDSQQIGEVLAGALGQNLGTVSTELIRKQMDVEPTIVIRPGYRFNVVITKDLVFPEPFVE